MTLANPARAPKERIQCRGDPRDAAVVSSRFMASLRPFRILVRISPLALVAALVVGTGGWGGRGALGQSSEVTLDAQGDWLSTRQPVEGTDEWTIARARRDLADDRAAAAYGVINQWIDRNERTGSPYLPEALLIRADAMTAMNDEYDALYDYERIIREYPGTPEFVTAIERELDLGVRYVNGRKRKFLGLRILDASDVGEELLIRVQERLPGSRLAERAGIELADYYYRDHELSLAAEAYELFNENYRNSQYAMKAMQRRIYATIAQYKGPRYDGSKLLDAQILVRRFSGLYPAEAQRVGLDDALLARLDESAAVGLLERAEWYLSRSDEPSARFVLQRLVVEHPRTSAAATALDMLEARGWKPTPPKITSPADVIENPAGEPAPESADEPVPAEGAAP